MPSAGSSGSSARRYVAPSARAASATAVNEAVADIFGVDAGREHGDVQPHPVRRAGDRTEQRESGDRSVARDDERLVLRVVPAFGERENLDAPGRCTA